MRTVLLFWLSLLAIEVNGANNEFTVPSPLGGMEVTEGASVEINWRCDSCASEVRLSVFQARNDAGGTWASEELFNSTTSPGAFTWSAHTYENLPKANGFHFTLNYKDSDNFERSFDSGDLHIVDKVATSTPTVTEVVESTPTPTSTPSASPASVTSTTPAPTTARSDSISETLKVGLGVGLGVGIPFLFLLGGLAGYLLFRRRSRPKTIPKDDLTPYDSPKVTYYGHEGVAELRDGLPYELRGGGNPHEMPQVAEKKPPCEMQG